MAMRVFTCKFQGFYLDGDMILVAHDVHEAFRMAVVEIDRLGLMHKNDPARLNLVPVDVKTRGATVLDDGDY